MENKKQALLTHAKLYIVIHFEVGEERRHVYKASLIGHQLLCEIPYSTSVVGC